MSDAPAIVWLRQDLRLADNPALAAAAASKRPLIVLYVLDEETPGPWRMGGASRWWLHKSLAALAADLAKRGATLTLRRGDAVKIVPAIVRESSAGAVYWNRLYEPAMRTRDEKIKAALKKAGVAVESSNGALMFEPWTIRTKADEPFKVFTPFWRACLRQTTRVLIPAPRKLIAHTPAPPSDALESWHLRPTKPDWANGFEPLWKPGEASALRALDRFLSDHLEHYPDARDQLGADGTSRLSPHLHFGEISPLQVRTATESAAAHEARLQRGADKFLTELGWREFSTNLLFHWANLPEQNWRDSFDAMPWRDDNVAFEAWTRGRTGYPVVDAAMRELWHTGYMHNRARMIVASFLIKHLMIDWRRGEAWFWDTLLDADLANNAASWQWVAGSGADAAPYFRIFNPVTQGERYDADGAYVRRWVPELAGLDDAHLHSPWAAPKSELDRAGVKLGQTYPHPIVDHAEARARALAAFAQIRNS